MRYYYKDNKGNYYNYKTKHNDLIEITKGEFDNHVASLHTTYVDEKYEIKQEMASIKAWLNANDYIINKHLLGEYTDDNPKWTNYLQQRATKLQRYNELEALL